MTTDWCWCKEGKAQSAWPSGAHRHEIVPRKATDVFPFKAHVHIDDANEIKVLRDMPYPQNLTVHVTNEHGISPDWTDNQHAHAYAHLYGRFRDGAEHFHTKEIR